jgi:membrane protein implicated in regulation of membrane protease activity
MGWLTPLYIATAIFGVGITLADLFGLFSHLAHGQGADAGHGAAHDAGGAHGAAHDTDGAHGAAHDTGSAHPLPAVHPSSVTHPSFDHPVSTEESTGSAVAQDVVPRGGGLVRAMSAVRSVVYFCLGFGPVGLFALTQYRHPAATLLWSVPVGVVVLVGARALRSLASREMSSEIAKEDLLMEHGTVLVTIRRGAMGKVRISVGGRYVDCYARGKEETELPVGARVRVVESSEDHVVVEAD